MLQIPAKVDYGVCALVSLATLGTSRTAASLAGDLGMSTGYLGSILTELRRAGLLAARRGGRAPGYRLSRNPEQITVADVVEALAGQMIPTRVFQTQDDDLSAEAAEDLQEIADDLQEVWDAGAASLRRVFKSVTIAELAVRQAHLREMPPDPIRDGLALQSASVSSP